MGTPTLKGTRIITSLPRAHTTYRRHFIAQYYAETKAITSIYTLNHLMVYTTIIQLNCIQEVDVALACSF